MKTIELKLYKFEELSQEAKDYAVDKQRDYEYEHGNPLEFFSEVYNEKLLEAGFEETKIQYSLSYSQGDGLSFSAKYFTKLELLYLEVLGKGKEKTAKLLAENTEVRITGNTGHYCYAHTSQVDLYFENYTSYINCENIDNIENVQGQVLNKLTTIYMNLCKELEDIGYKEIEYQQSDEAIQETIIANEYDFLEDGTQF